MYNHILECHTELVVSQPVDRSFFCVRTFPSFDAAVAALLAAGLTSGTPWKTCSSPPIGVTPQGNVRRTLTWTYICAASFRSKARIVNATVNAAVASLQHKAPAAPTTSAQHTRQRTIGRGLQQGATSKQVTHCPAMASITSSLVTPSGAAAAEFVLTIANVHSAHGSAEDGSLTQHDGHIRCARGLQDVVRAYVEAFYGNVDAAYETTAVPARVSIALPCRRCVSRMPLQQSYRLLPHQLHRSLMHHLSSQLLAQLCRWAEASEGVAATDVRTLKRPVAKIRIMSNKLNVLLILSYLVLRR
jgi:hypothetical protein